MIEVYKFEESDLDRMKFNKWAWPLKNKKSLKMVKNYLPQVNSFTVYDTIKDCPIAILAFHFYQKGCVYGMIIADDKFADNPKYAVVMKILIKRIIKDFEIYYTQTISEDAPELNKWHEFLGFKKEKSLTQYLRGKDFILWSM